MSTPSLLLQKLPKPPPPFKRVGQLLRKDANGKAIYGLLPPPPPPRPKPTPKPNIYAHLPPYDHTQFLKPGQKPPEVVFVNTPEAVDEAVARLSSPVGLDIEWTPSYKKGVPPGPVALMQIADNNLIVLIHFVRMIDYARVNEFAWMRRIKPPPKLREFLEDESVIKVGVGIRQDACKISKDLGTTVRGVVDLNQISLKDSQSYRMKSLAKYVGQLLGRSLSKPPELVKSKWDSWSLSNDQIAYAASDALSGLQAYQALRTSALAGHLSQTWHLQMREDEEPKIFDYATQRIFRQLPSARRFRHQLGNELVETWGEPAVGLGLADEELAMVVEEEEEEITEDPVFVQEEEEDGEYVDEKMVEDVVSQALADYVEQKEALEQDSFLEEERLSREYVPGYVVMPEDAIALDMFLEGQTLESIGEEIAQLRTQAWGGAVEGFVWKPLTIQRRIVKALDMDRSVELTPVQWDRLTCTKGPLRYAQNVDDAMEIIEPLLKSRRQQGF